MESSSDIEAVKMMKGEPVYEPQKNKDKTKAVYDGVKNQRLPWTKGPREKKLRIEPDVLYEPKKKKKPEIKIPVGTSVVMSSEGKQHVETSGFSSFNKANEKGLDDGLKNQPLPWTKGPRERKMRIEPDVLYEPKKKKKPEIKIPVGTSVVMSSEGKQQLNPPSSNDSFCPNCFSCITNRIILRKRLKQRDYSSLPSSYDFFCPNCSSCITSGVILRKKQGLISLQQSLGPEEAGIMSLSTLSRMLLEDDNDEEVKLAFLRVIHKFLKSSYFCCPNCINYVNTVVIREQTPITGTSLQGCSRSEVVDEDIMVLESKLDHGDQPELHFKMLCLLLSSRNFHCPICDACISKLLIQWAQSLASAPKQQQLAESLEAQDQESGVAKPGSVAVQIPPHEKMEMLKSSNTPVFQCILSDGLFASITSLIIVTSATSANISNENVVALALANLITGVFLIRYNLARAFKKKKLKTELNGIEVDHQEVDEYREKLKDGVFYLLYFMMALFSFILLGVLPPLVYAAVTFTDDRNLKLVIVAAASLLCITLLAFFKARLQKLPNWLANVKIVIRYVCSGTVTLGISYAAGDLFRKLVE